MREKLADDLEFVQEIRIQVEEVQRMKAKLAESRRMLDELDAETWWVSANSEAFTAVYAGYRKAVDIHNGNVAQFAKQFQRYNQFVDEYNRLSAVLLFIQHNQLDWPVVSAQVRNLRV